MHAFSLISSILFLLYLQMGIFVFLKNRNSRINQMFLGLSLCFAIWSLGYVFVYSAADIVTVLKWDQFAMIGYALFPAFMVGFNIYMGGVKFVTWLRRMVFFSSLLLGVIILILGFMGYGTPHEVYMGRYSWQFKYPPWDAYYIFLYFYVALTAGISLYLLLKWFKNIGSNKRDIKQFRIIFYPFVFFAALVISFDIVLPAFHHAFTPMIGHLGSFPWLLGISFAILRYQFLSNPDHIMSDQVMSEIKEVVIFVDTENKIIRTNRFTNKLLARKGDYIRGSGVLSYFENKPLINGYLHKVKSKYHLGPVGLTLIDASGNQIETSLSFLSIRDRFDDFRGCIIYGHDNREALNLQKEIIIRQHAEKNLRTISEVLETRVQERTRELANSYKELQVKMTERMRIEEQIKADIAEKEILIHEIHNRVKNNMNIIISLINAQDKKNTSRIASQKFADLAQRVKTLLLVHQNLYLSINYSDVDFAGFLRTLTDELLILHKRSDQVELRMEVSDVFLDVDYAIPLGIIVNELISNALQHGFSAYHLGRNKEKQHMLYIGYNYNDGNYEVTINDNGRGLPKDFNIADLTTNGLPLAEILVNDQINGKMEVFSSSEGTLFKIVFLAAK